VLRKNQPTVAELKSLYESEMYQNLLNEFAKRSKRELDNNEQDKSELLKELTWLRKCYALLDAPFEEILSEFERSKDLFLDYLVANLKKCNNDRIELPIVSRIYKTCLLEYFCDFYMAITAIRQESTTRQ
jgi:DNA-binding transcriptional regulator GbsR (MarR family)